MALRVFRAALPAGRIQEMAGIPADTLVTIYSVPPEWCSDAFDGLGTGKGESTFMGGNKGRNSGGDPRHPQKQQRTRNARDA